MSPSEHQSSDRLVSAVVLKWSCHSWRASFSACHNVPRDWCSSSFLLPFAGAPVVGLADLKCWWCSSSDWAGRYIFIILQSAPKTLSLVFKVLDGQLQSEPRGQVRACHFRGVLLQRVSGFYLLLMGHVTLRWVLRFYVLRYCLKNT